MLEYIIDLIKNEKEILLVTIIPTIVLIVAIIIGIKYSEYECQQKAKFQELEYYWGFVEGCMVKKDGKWIDYERYRILE